MDKTEIEKKANAVFVKLKYKDSSNAIDVISIARNLGFTVVNAVMNDNDVDGFIIIQEGADTILGIKTEKLIGVNASKDLVWKRFTIAHEIGHYILHYNAKKNNGLYAHREHRTGKNNQENEADFFAANLLMPRQKFIQKYSELKEKELTADEILLLLTNHFNVTKRMVKRRYIELELNEEVL